MTSDKKWFISIYEENIKKYYYVKIDIDVMINLFLT